MKYYVHMKYILSISMSILWLTSSNSLAAISLDRTRVIFNESEKTVVVNINNDNKQLPYLAQAWLEDDKMNKLTKGPIALTPPVQRIEPGERSLITLTTTALAKELAADRESVFYFILRRFPQKVKKTMLCKSLCRLRSNYFTDQNLSKVLLKRIGIKTLN